MSARWLASLLVGGCLLAPGATAQPPALGGDAPGRVTCRVSDNRASAAGYVTHPDTGAQADCAVGLKLTPGWHRLQVHLADAPGAAVRTRWLQLAAGAHRLLEVAFETGEVVLQTTRKGEPVKAEADVWRNGSVCARLRSGHPQKLPIGAYVLDARAGDLRRRFESVHVAPNGRTVVAWSVRP